MSSTVTVKVFYERSNGQNEIRRFPINTSHGTKDCLSVIKNTVEELFITHNRGNLQLCWQDPEGDRVAFSKTDELREALDYVTDGVLRVYIPESKEEPQPIKEPAQETKDYENTKEPHQPSDQGKKQQQHQESQKPSAKQTESQSTNNGDLHPGVMRDGCYKPIHGMCIRFKCCLCQDYDLCSSREGEGMHEEHEMTRINKPRMNPPNPLYHNMHSSYMRRCDIIRGQNVLARRSPQMSTRVFADPLGLRNALARYSPHRSNEAFVDPLERFNPRSPRGGNPDRLFTIPTAV